MFLFSYYLLLAPHLSASQGLDFLSSVPSSQIVRWGASLLSALFPTLSLPLNLLPFLPPTLFSLWHNPSESHGFAQSVNGTVYWFIWRSVFLFLWVLYLHSCTLANSSSQTSELQCSQSHDLFPYLFIYFYQVSLISSSYMGSNCSPWLAHFVKLFHFGQTVTIPIVKL